MAGINETGHEMPPDPWALQEPMAWADDASCAGGTMGGSLPGYMCQVRPVLQNPGPKGLQETHGWEERVDVSWHMHSGKQAAASRAALSPSGTEGEEEASPRGQTAGIAGCLPSEKCHQGACDTFYRNAHGHLGAQVKRC